MIRLNQTLVGAVARLPMRVQTKLLSAFLAIAVLLISLGALGLYTLSAVNQRTEELIQSERKIAAYRQVQHDTTSQLYTVSSALVISDEHTLDSALRQLNQFGYDLERLQFVAKDELQLLGAVRQEYDRFIVVMTRVVELIGSGHIAEAREAQLKEARPLANRLERLTNELVNRAEADVVSVIEASGAAYRNSQTIVIAFALGAITLALVLGRTISWSLIGPIREIDATLGEIAAGDFTRRVKVGNRDELGGLGANVNRMSEQLGNLYQQLEAEKARTEALLANILPRSIVERMRRGETEIADHVAEATILFADLVDFTRLAARLSPQQTVALLADVFCRFDGLAAQYGLEKIKTTGDGYMVAGGLPEERTDHATAIAEMALAMVEEIGTAGDAFGVRLEVRIGLNTGALIAGVLGTHKFVYDVWGDTVNIAKRMESYGLPGRVHVSAATRRALGGAFRFEPRGVLNIKGKGLVEAYFLYRWE
jgi:class 3 adenylate cyclase/CHASE3 domain sensor protein